MQRTAPRRAALLPFGPTHARIVAHTATKVASLRDLGPDWDVVAELTHNREAYTTSRDDSSLSLYLWPTDLDLAVASLRALVPRRPGVHPTAACCIHYGVQVLRQDSDVQALLDLRRRFDALPPATSPDVLETLAVEFRTFDPGIPFRPGRRLNLRLPGPLASELGELASDTGIRTPTLALIATTITLAIQPRLNSSHRSEWDASLAKFWRMVQLRTLATSAVMSAFKVS